MGDLSPPLWSGGISPPWDPVFLLSFVLAVRPPLSWAWPVPRLRPSPSSVDVALRHLPGPLCHSFMNNCAPTSILSYHYSALLALASHPCWLVAMPNAVCTSRPPQLISAPSLRRMVPRSIGWKIGRGRTAPCSAPRPSPMWVATSDAIVRKRRLCCAGFVVRNGRQQAPEDFFAAQKIGCSERYPRSSYKTYTRGKKHLCIEKYLSYSHAKKNRVP